MAKLPFRNAGVSPALFPRAAFKFGYARIRAQV